MLCCLDSPDWKAIAECCCLQVVIKDIDEGSGQKDKAKPAGDKKPAAEKKPAGEGRKQPATA